MPIVNSHEIAQRIGAQVVGSPADAHVIVADSRDVLPGVAFAAVSGGHAFVGRAVLNGAPFVIVREGAAVPPDATAIVVDDVVRALGSVASAVRERSRYEVVGITGSTGKTLTKDFIAAALRTKFRVHATPRSYNAELGVPLTVLGARDDTEVLVAELAARRPGEIADLAAIVRPRIGVITGVGTSHLELFGTRETIARTKSELTASLPGDGLAVVPADDDFVDVFAETTPARIAAVGHGARVSYRADRIDGAGRTHGRIRIDSDVVPVVIPVPGRPLVRNAALAVRVAVELGIEPGDAAAALADAPLSSLRMEILSVGDRTIVNDAWNSNPTSLSSALRSVRELAGGRECWAVLGHMAELGTASAAQHRRMGALAAALGYRGLIVVGDEAAELASGAGSIAHRVRSVPEAADAVGALTPPSSVVLVKASRVAGLERLVGELGAAEYSAG